MLQKTVEIYITASGREPFVEWIVALRDDKARARIRNRISEMPFGHFGDCEAVGEGVFELRFFFGPGFRVYFAQYKHSIILLLCGGDKKTQTTDIKTAKKYWKEFKERKNENNTKL